MKFLLTMIAITPAAVNEIRRMQNLRQQSNLRLTLGNSGCEQFYYDLNLVNELAVDDVIYVVNGLTVGLEGQFSQYLENIQIDFAQDLMGGGFRFQNPHAIKVCGCGNAFTAKIGGDEVPGAAFEI